MCIVPLYPHFPLAVLACSVYITVFKPNTEITGNNMQDFLSFGDAVVVAGAMLLVALVAAVVVPRLGRMIGTEGGAKGGRDE